MDRIEFFASQSELQALEDALTSAPADPAAQCALAWALRQRDPLRAQALCRQTLALAGEDAEGQLLRLRCQLVLAEHDWLHGRLNEAVEHAQYVIKQSAPSESIQFAALQADAWWLLGWVANESGDTEKRSEAWQAMHVAALNAQDSLRAEFAKASLASMLAFHDPVQAQSQAERYQSKAGNQTMHSALRAVVHDFLGLTLRISDDLKQCVGYWLNAYESANESGQVRRSAVLACNIGNIFVTLNDAVSAMEWMERGLGAARTHAWPGLLGNCLMHTASCLRLMGRLDAAHDLMQESLQCMTPYAGSRNHAVSYVIAGDIDLARQDGASALHNFSMFKARADTLKHSDLQGNARRGIAKSLLMLQRPQEAWEMAQEALTIMRAVQDVSGQIDVLHIMAEIHAYQAGAHFSQAQLDCLLQAQALGATITGYCHTPELLDAIADAYARDGQLQQAFEYARKSARARDALSDVKAENRALSLQLQYQSERMRAESEHLRQLAQAEARRAEILQDTGNTLSHLGAIGREITAQRNLSDLFALLNQHVNNLLDASYFAILLMDEDGSGLHSVYRVQNKQSLPPYRQALPADNSYVAQCVLEKREVIMSMQAGQHNPALRDDASPTLSALFGPLQVGERVLGAMTIQSSQADAYGERERLIFRNLCAYGAIALDNANAYRQLQQTQRQLVEQEKLAALGSLVAGVAHELNTPLGNSITIASSIQELWQDLEQRLQAQTLSMARLQDCITDGKQASHLLQRALHSAAHLVSTFKQVAVDRTSAERRSFDLSQTTQEIVATMMSQIRANGHSITLEIAPNIELQSYPGHYGQVIASLISNALVHAFAGQPQGQIRIWARLHKPGRVLICCSDNGCGIAPQHLAHIFDPFFTTCLGQGGNGLGLNIAYNLVTSLLQGSIEASSTPGQGACFSLDLPLVAH
ncbi:ATP-binding protein [Massilia sp. W12]|uniref:ATP-binding protein n=1 Tax=Massilia sp. W12 TaxID=3126507 RepID=UPI0030CBD253